MKKRYKLKKEPFTRLLVVLIIVFIILILGVNYFNGRFVRKLKKLGYTTTEIKTLKENKVSLRTVSKYKYINELISIVENKNYKEENLRKYLDLYQDKYDIDTVLYIVNHDLSYEYSDKLASIIHEEYFIDSRLDRYMNYTNESKASLIVRDVNSNRDFDYYTNTISTDTTKDKLMLVNKYYYLDSNYKVDDLVKVDNMYANLNSNSLNKEAYEAIKKLIIDADKLGYNIRINYSYRDYETQEGIYNGYKESKGVEYADSYAARAGFSEHQTGYSVDVGVQSKYSNGSFKSSKEYTWMKDNSYKYGYILRYPEGKENITGYSFEPWHYRYVGQEAAKYIYEHNITFDEYYAYFIEK